MPNRRAMIAMSEAEMWQFIESQKHAQVCTLNRDGSPHLTTLWFAIRDGAIVLETFSKSQKVVNLKRDPRIAVLFEDGDDYATLRGVSINCEAQLVDDYETVHDLHAEVILRNRPGTSREEALAYTADMSRKKTVILVRPDKVMSWDHRKLDVAY
jgi:PPOX class probable F420-dependent enzyme